MRVPFSKETEPIDHKTSKSICDAIGERLQQHMQPETSALSGRLQQLLDELRRRDRPGSA